MEPYRPLWPTQLLASEAPGPAAALPTTTKHRRVRHLFEPYTIRSLTLKNRIVVSPMCMYSSEDGLMNDWHLVHLGSFAKGGAGLVIFEASAVVPDGRITPWDAGIWKDEHIEPMKRIVDFIHHHKSAACLQIAHAGRKASTFPPHLTFAKPRAGMSEDIGGWPVVGPSQVPYSSELREPKEMKIEEIQNTIKAFVDAAVRADKAGFDAIEVHGAHGYLISSFNSPLSNKRTDSYGGSFQGRTKLCLEIVSQVRKVWPQHKPLFVRLSCTDWVEGGWDISQTVRLGYELKKLDVDVVDCSSAGQSPEQKVVPGPSYQVPFSDQVRREVGIATCAVGDIREAVQAEEILLNKRADLVAIGREFLRDPYWPIHAARHLGLDLHWPVQYDWAVGPKL